MLYKVVFNSHSVDTEKIRSTKKQVARRFRLNKTKLEKLFSGKNIVLKRNISYEKAKRIHDVMFQSGARCAIRRMSVPQAPGDIKTEPLPAFDAGKNKNSTRIGEYPRAPILTDWVVIDETQDLGERTTESNRRHIDRRIHLERRYSLRKPDRRSSRDRRKHNEAWEGLNP